ncbi:hypothetical protein OL233_04530 [Vagococcus sp. PNs007]|uniref:Mga helix-turn-helix domain-containing protein n=1 Tax=Vagococcus proximus TaxID=2991417 RepID=A0ABT5X0L5_9ENTE|nr:hypothetical protein [Vagococcus proximus]MDF0479549.1 hypothetical protein [Vagococcus proximus]
MKLTMNRNVSPKVKQLLTLFLENYTKNGLSEHTTLLLYDFILLSYQVSVRERYSISLLAEELLCRNLEVSMIINIYYHSLNCLALSNGEKVYRGGFIV